MEQRSESKRIRIAISGGGLAGATLISALMKQKHLEVHIFESAPEFSERGAAVGIASHAQSALQELGPELLEALKNAGAVPSNSTKALIGCGVNAGAVVLDAASAGIEPDRVVHRAAFLAELLRHVPSEIMHTSKKLVGVEETENGSLILSFKDGSKETFDALIGADGIHGFVRPYILGDHPSSKAKFAGFWDCRSLVPIAKARELLNEELFREPRQYGWSGDGSFFMHDCLDNGEIIQCVASVMTDEKWDTNEWKRKLDRKILEEGFAPWTNSTIKDGMIDLLLMNPDLYANAQWAHEVHAPTYAKGRVCIMGDASHAMTPWQGSGAAMAIEDAMILATLLKEVKEPRNLEAAFRAYDEVRRPRTQRLVESSKVTGYIICGREPGVGLDPEKMLMALAPRWDWINDLVMQEHKEEALEAMKSLL